MSPRTKAPTARPERNLATPEEVAEFLQVPVLTLQKWRTQRRGPSYTKPGGKHVRYSWPAVTAWLESQEQRTA
jgi:excisionase family DNA binding protein